MVAYYVLGHSFANYFHVPWKDCAGESRSDPKGKAILRRMIEYLMNKEQWIAELREKAENLDRRIYRQSQVYTGLSCILHVILFFRLSLLDETPILFARLFVFIQVLVHVNLLLVLTPTLNTPIHRLAKELPHVPVSIPWTLGIASFAPLVSFLSGRSWTQTGWWSVAAVITLLVWLMLQSVQDSRTNLESLEKLKYDAKGA